MVKIQYPVEPSICHFKTDKIHYHGYFPAYMQIAAELGPAASVCEIGVLFGESLRMWQSLFPLGQVTGVDCDPDAYFPEGTYKVLGMQDAPELASFGPFDLIVDDGSHQPADVQKTFENMWPQVNPGGFYVVEDWFIAFGNEERPGISQMLATVSSFLSLLDSPNGECESVLYKYGLAILRKRA